jgi:hypothetical protein
MRIVITSMAAGWRLSQIAPIFHYLSPLAVRQITRNGSMPQPETLHKARGMIAAGSKKIVAKRAIL